MKDDVPFRPLRPGMTLAEVAGRVDHQRAKPKRKLRVIDILRANYPGEWRYMGAGEWDGPDFIVYAIRYGAGAYNGDDPSKLDLGIVHYYRTDIGGGRDRLVPELIDHHC